MEYYNSTVSKSSESFLGFAPDAIKRGKGAYVWDGSGRRYLDLGMALGSVTLGHCIDEVDEFVISTIKDGVNFSRPSVLERHLSESLSHFCSQDFVAHFSKSSSMLLSVVPRVCRAITGKKGIAFPSNASYLGNVDWFIGSTSNKLGIYNSEDQIYHFSTDNVESCAKYLAANASKLACIIMEPYRVSKSPQAFYEMLRQFCTQNNVILVFDETISGFRYEESLAQYSVECDADMTVVGKAIANGYALGAVLTPRAFYETRIFPHLSNGLYSFSSTHSGETIGLSAALKTLDVMSRDKVIVTNNSKGAILQSSLKSIIASSGHQNYIVLEGQPSYFYIKCYPCGEFTDKSFRARIYEEFFKNDILFRGTFAMSMSLSDSDIKHVSNVFEAAVRSL